MTLWRAAVGECGANVVRGDPLTFLQVGRHLRAYSSLGALVTSQFVHFNGGSSGQTVRNLLVGRSSIPGVAGSVVADAS